MGREGDSDTDRGGRNEQRKDELLHGPVPGLARQRIAGLERTQCEVVHTGLVSAVLTLALSTTRRPRAELRKRATTTGRHVKFEHWAR